MKRIVFIFLGLFSFMTMITNEHFCFDGQKALAQRMYAELDDVVIIGSASGGGSYNGGFGEPNDNSGYWDDLFGGSSDNGNNSENNDGDNSYVEPDYGSDEPGPSSPPANAGNKAYCKGISKEDIIKGLKKSSMKILQTGSTCSAAVLQKLLAEYSPELYRQIVMSLYEKGEYKPWGLFLSDCYKDLKLSDVNKNYGQNEKKDPVDFIMQCALINKMNWAFHYNPTIDTGDNILGNLSGMQSSERVMGFITDYTSYNMVDYDDITYDFVKDLNCSDKFVIAFVKSSKEEDNYNFEGTKRHFAQIIKVTDDYIYYWSWGGINKASINSWTGISKVIIVTK